MISSRFVLTYVLFVICQILLCNYLNFGPITILTILPVMIMCIPLEVSTLAAVIMAFLSGIFVDLTCDGVIGLNAFALMPLAMLRKPIMQLFFGSDTASRREKFDFQTSGFVKVSYIILLSLGIFLLLYIWADGAGIRSFGFNLLRFVCSLAVSYAFSLVVVTYFSSKQS